MLPSWSKLADYVEHQAQCDKLGELSRSFKSFVEPFEIDTFACGKLKLTDRRLNTFFVIEWPDSWRKFYFKSGLINRDPIIEYLKEATGPFTWSELRQNRLLAKVGSEPLRGAAERGWTEGLVVPVETGGPVMGLVSLVSRRAAFTTEEKAFLTLVSCQFYQRAKDLALIRGVTLPPAGLTAREIECLQLIALGYSDRRVGEELGISTTTAHEHFENAKKKLNAGSRSTVVAIAISLAAIRPQ